VSPFRRCRPVWQDSGMSDSDIANPGIARATGVEAEKAAAARTAASLVVDGMTVGLGTGSTVAYLIPALASRGLALTCVATSPATEMQARAAGLDVRSFNDPSSPALLDIAIDGADKVTPDGWLVKGAGAAHTREKIVAAAADRFVVIVSTEKLVTSLAPPVPLEILSFGASATLRRLGAARIRPQTPHSPDGGIIVDWMNPVDDPRSLCAFFDSTPGVVGHGLFPPEMVSDVVVSGRLLQRSATSANSWVRLGG